MHLTYYKCKLKITKLLPSFETLILSNYIICICKDHAKHSSSYSRTHLYNYIYGHLIFHDYNDFVPLLNMFLGFHRPTSALNQKPITNGNIPQREDTEYPSSGFGSLPNKRSLFPSGIYTST